MKDLMACTQDMQCFAFGIDNENFLMMSSTASNIQLWNQIIAVYLENRASYNWMLLGASVLLAVHDIIKNGIWA